jgi:hypothetical protein
MANTKKAIFSVVFGEKHRQKAGKEQKQQRFEAEKELNDYSTDFKGSHCIYSPTTKSY